MKYSVKMLLLSVVAVPSIAIAMEPGNFEFRATGPNGYIATPTKERIMEVSPGFEFNISAKLSPGPLNRTKWTLLQYHPFELVKSDFVAPMHLVPGDAGMQVWTFKASEKGKFEIEFQRELPTGETQERIITVDVK